MKGFDEKWYAEQMAKKAGASTDTPAPAKRKTILPKDLPCPLEEEEQVTLAQFLDLMFWEQWFHVPMGGLRNKAEGGKLKAQGAKAGIPDNWIVRPVKGAPGVVVELKRVKGGVVSEDQKKWLKTLAGFGWICRVCAGADEAIKFVRNTYGI